MNTSIQYPAEVQHHLKAIAMLDADKTTPAIEFATSSQAGRLFYNPLDRTGLIPAMVQAHKAQTQQALSRYGVGLSQVDGKQLQAGITACVQADLMMMDDEYGWDFPSFSEQAEDVIWYRWFAGEVCKTIFANDPEMNARTESGY